MRWSTPAQQAASKANAQHSTGPKTAEGKAASSRNATRFGLTGSRFLILNWENEDEFDEILHELTAEFKPFTPDEILLVGKMAQHYWLAQRALSLQAKCLDLELPMLRDFGPSQSSLALYLRYQATHDRAYHKCRTELLKLRAAQDKQVRQIIAKERVAAAETRKTEEANRKKEFHETRLRFVKARAEHQELKNQALRRSAVDEAAVSQRAEDSNKVGFVSQNTASSAPSVPEAPLEHAA